MSGPAWRAYAGELRSNANPCLADFVGVLLELRFLIDETQAEDGDDRADRDVPWPFKDQGPVPGHGLRDQGGRAILLAHGVPETYHYEAPDPEASRIHGLSVLFWATVRAIFDEVARGAARPWIGVKLIDSVTGKCGDKIYCITTDDLNRCCSTKRDVHSDEVLDFFKAAAYDATGVRYVGNLV